MFVILISIATLIYNNSDDYSYFGKFFEVFRSIYVDVFLLLIASRTLKNENILESFSWFWGASLTFCVSFTIATLLIPELRIYWQSLIVQTQFVQELVDMEMYITRFSIGGFSGYGQTIMCSIGVALSLFLICRGHKVGYIFLVFSIVGNLFYGRIGLILSGIAIIVFMIQSKNIKIIAKSFIVIMLIVTFISIFFKVTDIPLLYAWASWLIDPIESFMNGLQYGQITFGSSGNKLVYDMYWLPNVDTLILGDGRYTDESGSYYMHTDAGYMRIVLYFGMMGAFFLYMLFMLLFLWAKHVNKFDRLSKYVTEVLLCFFIVEEYKGDAFQLLFGMMSVCIVCGILKLDNKDIR